MASKAIGSESRSKVTESNTKNGMYSSTESPKSYVNKRRARFKKKSKRSRRPYKRLKYKTRSNLKWKATARKEQVLMD